MIEFLFTVFALFAIGGALGMLFNTRNTIAAAMCLVVTMIALGAIYVLLEAYFIGAIQILVYAGAILVLFLFVVMLLNLRQDTFPPIRQRLLKAFVAGIGLLVLLQFLTLLPGSLPEAAAVAEGYGGYRHVGFALFTDYLLAFETTSMLLLSAMVGAIILAKRRIG